jgi:hypothetical protein
MDRECSECHQTFDWGGGSFRCSDECREAFTARRDREYNRYRRAAYQVKKRRLAGEINELECADQTHAAYLEYRERIEQPALVIKIPDNFRIVEAVEGLTYQITFDGETVCDSASEEE